MAHVGPIAAALLDGDSTTGEAGQYTCGQDGSNLARPLLVDASGRPLVVNKGPDGNDGAIVEQIHGAYARGRVSGGFAGRRDGFVATAAAATFTVEPTTYTEPASAAQRSIASANANDTAAGTGARTVEITYYDGSMNGPFTETITMNGVTPVNTVATNIRFIEKMEVITAGSLQVNNGIISLFGATGGGGGTVWTIPAFLTRAEAARHYIASGKIMSLKTILGVSNNTAALAFLRVRDPVSGIGAHRYIGPTIRLSSAASGGQVTELEAFTISGPARLTMFVLTDTSAASTIAAGFSFYED